MLRAADKWLWGYVRSVFRRPEPGGDTRHLIFGVADHYEPFRDRAPKHEALARVKRWVDGYHAVVDEFRDADGRMPHHTFFYPEEEYDPDIVGMVVEMCRQGCGEMEIHLHHRHDTAEGLRRKLIGFRDRLHERHGCLGKRGGAVAYGFVHGNWSLCNSRPDGDWCGVNEELGILADTGCYADFTFPSAPSPTQPRIVNAIYRAKDRPGLPRGPDRGTLCRTGHVQVSGLGVQPLLLVQGPLGLDGSRRKWGILPRLENAEVSGSNLPRPERVDLWVRQGIHVLGRPEWIFVKVHTHGCVTRHADVWLGDSIRGLHGYLRERYNDGDQWQLHYVTAREMVNIARAAEDGMTGNPGRYRDYEIRPPEARREGGNLKAES